MFRFDFNLRDDPTFAEGNGNDRILQPLNGRKVKVILGAVT